MEGDGFRESSTYYAVPKPGRALPPRQQKKFTPVSDTGPPVRPPDELTPTQGQSLMTSITPFLWFDNNVPEAVAFYKSVFPNAKVETVNDFMATFELEGQRFNALNGGPKYKFNEAVSFFISVETQEEVDYFWNRLTADGGEESRCGWLKDKFGLSWQVVPKALGRYLSDPDRQKADRAMQAMMKMQKIVIADLDKAFAG
jgi:predicted 3-demethylubiquinone-9 3-methyltransferase (glyoxalase superfamily)